MHSKYEDRPYPCDICHKRFDGPQHLKVHLDVVHGNKLKFKCKLCDQEFKEGAVLETHMNAVHLNIKPFECRICDYASASRSSRRQHEKFKHKYVHTKHGPKNEEK